ncbi:MAG: hypothetical protein ACON4E_00430 [Flavobacteriales bacterium]
MQRTLLLMSVFILSIVLFSSCGVSEPCPNYSGKTVNNYELS